MRIKHQTLKKGGIVLGTLIATVLMFGFFGQVKAKSALKLTFPSSTVKVGQTVKAAIIITPETKGSIQVAMVDLTYDPNTLELVTCTPGEKFEAIVDENPCTEDAPGSGSLRIDVENKDDVEPTGTVPLAYITFKAKNPGKPSFSFTSHDIIAEYNEEPIELQLKPQISETVTVVQ